MREFLMNPWTVTVVGGLAVGLAVFFITRRRVSDETTPQPHGAKVVDRGHSIVVDDQGRLRAGGSIKAGDEAGGDRDGGGTRQHKIRVHGQGEISAGGNIIAGDQGQAGQIEP